MLDLAARVTLALAAPHTTVLAAPHILAQEARVTQDRVVPDILVPGVLHTMVRGVPDILVRVDRHTMVRAVMHMRGRVGRVTTARVAPATQVPVAAATVLAFADSEILFAPCFCSARFTQQALARGHYVERYYSKSGKCLAGARATTNPINACATVPGAKPSLRLRGNSVTAETIREGPCTG